MGTILGIATPAGVVLAGDRRHAKGSTVTSDGVQRVHDFGRVGAASVGGPGAVRSFASQLEADLRAYETEHGEPMPLDRVAHVAAGLASDAGVDALVAARTDDGSAGLRELGQDGSLVHTERSALGSGAPIAFGRLESDVADDDLDAVAAFARETMATVADRDTETGPESDTYRLASEH